MDLPKESLQDLELSQIDFDWVENQNKPNFLKKGLKLLETDGNYYPELSTAIKEKLKTLDPKYKSLLESTTIDPIARQKALDDILLFEEEISQKNKKQVFGQDDLAQLKAKAENEKIKGNEALRSNDLNEALNYYTKSLEYDDKMAASYCNRALVYLKLKKYQETVQDCKKALEIDPGYIKAYHRRGKANMELKKYLEAVKDFQFIMSKEPDNKEVNADLKEARKNLSQKEVEMLEKGNENPSSVVSGGFKKIEIQEEDEEEEDSNTKNIIKEFEDRKAKANEMTKKGNFLDAIKFYESDLKLIEKMENPPKEIASHKANLLNNISFCHSQTGEANKAITYATEVINLKDVDEDQKLKALLRRALQYEKIDKEKKAKEDYLEVKRIDPNNMKASEGLYRLREVKVEQKVEIVAPPPKIIEEKVEKKEQKVESKVVEKPSETKSAQKEEQKADNSGTSSATAQKNDSEEKLKELETKKEKGNDYFRKKDFPEAKKIFNEIVVSLQEAFSAEIKNPTTKAGTLFLQILNNRAFTNFNINHFDEAIKDCDLTLSLDPSNLKGLYRRGLSYYERSKSLRSIMNSDSLQDTLLDSARKDIENLMKLNKDNQAAREKLQEIVKESVKIKIKIRDSKKNENTEGSEKNPKVEMKKPVPKQQENTKFDDEFINNVTFDVSKKVMQDLINSKELPPTSNVFEKDCQAFKNDIDKLFFYVRKISLEHFTKLFTKKDIPTETLWLIVQSFKINGIKEDAKFVALFLENLLTTTKFDMVLMLLTKKEKKEIQELVQELEGVDSELSKLIVKFKKALK